MIIAYALPISHLTPVKPTGQLQSKCPLQFIFIYFLYYDYISIIGKCS